VPDLNAVLMVRIGSAPLCAAHAVSEGVAR
jgi:hypothetical protein